MKVTIITPSYNSAKTIRDTLNSVASQTYKDIEHIVMDGGSSDGTQDIAKEYDHVMLVSEPDNGIYDAMNKGVKRADGDIICVLNSDDFYRDENVIEQVLDTFENASVDTCYGDIEYVDRGNIDKIVRKWEAGEFRGSKLKYGWIPPHPAFFVRKRIYENCGLYDLNFSIAADYEFMLRLFAVYNVSTAYIPETLVSMRPGGHSGKSLMQRIYGWKELRKAWDKHDLDRRWYFSVTRPLFKFGQIINF